MATAISASTTPVTMALRLCLSTTCPSRLVSRVPRLLDHRLHFERVVRRRRRQVRPLERVRAFPRLLGGGAAAADALDDVVEEEQLREPEDERADRRDHVPLGEL